MTPVITPLRIVALLLFGVLSYILLVGPERFYFEAFGTLLLAPIICVRLLPPSLSHELTRLLGHHPILCSVICLIPVFMLGFAIVFGAYALRKESTIWALASAFVTVTVFAVYHWVQPMGVTLVRY